VFIELIDSLRCPHEHEETWLVAAFNEMRDRFVVEATLGCPVCSATFKVKSGVADLRLITEARERSIEQSQNDSESAMRLAAFLNLVRPGSVVILAGSHAPNAGTIAELTESRVFAINPVTRLQDSERVATVLADTRLPFATSSVDGIAVDDASFSVADITRVLKPGGRLVAPAAIELAGSIREIARDENYVVAEAVGPLLSLKR
jgi:hypothetical protein